MSNTDEIDLAKSLAVLRQSFDRVPDRDVIALWEAIGTISRHNKRCAQKGVPTYPMPDWIGEYLAETADKISCLWLGIDPTDNRPFHAIPFDEVGKLRAVPQSDGGGAVRPSDERTSHVAQAFGFAGDGWSAFKRHDRAVRDAQLLAIYDDPALEEHPQLRKEVRGSLLGLVTKQKNVTAEATKNSLSKARTRHKSAQK